MFRRSLWLLGLLALVLAACVAVPPAAPAPSGTLAEAAYPVTLTDDLGREVTLTARPQRLVVMSPSGCEIVAALGVAGRVAGISDYCNYPPDAWTGKASVGGFSADSLSVETILSLQPDLVFSAGGIQAPVIEALAQAGIPVFALDATDFDSIYRNIHAAGQLTGTEAEADALVADMQVRVAAVQAAVQDVPEAERPLVFYEVWDEPLMTAGPGTFIGQIIELAGGINVFADVTEDYPQISGEVVVERDPAIILGPSSHADGLAVEDIAVRAGWEAMRAVQEGAVYILDGDAISRPGPRVVDALEEVARILYPERFTP